MASTQSARHVLGDLGEQAPLELEVLGRGLDHEPGGARGRRGSPARLERAERLALERGPSRRRARAARGRSPGRARAPRRRGRAAACARPPATASWAIPAPIVPAPSTPMTSGPPAHRCEYYRVDPFTVIFGGTLGVLRRLRPAARDVLQALGDRHPRLEADALARGRGAERHRRHPADDRRAERAPPPARAARARRGARSRRACAATARSSPSSARRYRTEDADVARVLIVPCGCRGRALARRARRGRPRGARHDARRPARRGDPRGRRRGLRRRPRPDRHADGRARRA